MKAYIKLVKNNWLPGHSCGWGNGYVVLPKGHKYHGMHYDELNSFVDVHGGLTYSEMESNGGWCVGFDTAHFGDTIEEWPLERVEQEAERLLQQLDA